MVGRQELLSLLRALKAAVPLLECWAKGEGRWVTTDDGRHIYIDPHGIARTKPGGKIIHRKPKPRKPGKKPASEKPPEKPKKSGKKRPKYSKEAMKEWERSATPEELRAFDDWKVSDYESIRRSIASGKPNKKAKTFMRLIERAPAYEGVVYRGMSFRGSELEAFVAKCRRDGRLVAKSPMSATKIAGIGEEFASHIIGNKGVLLRIKAKSGADLSGLSRRRGMFEDEKEVILMHGTSYRVSKIRSVDRGNVWYEIDLEEE